MNTTTADHPQRRRDVRSTVRPPQPPRPAPWRLEGTEKDQGDQLIYLVSQRLRSDRRAAEFARTRDSRRTWALSTISLLLALALAVLSFGGWQLMDRNMSGSTTIVLTMSLIALGALSALLLGFSLYTFRMHRVMDRDLREAHDETREAERMRMIRQALLAARLSYESEEPTS